MRRTDFQPGRRYTTDDWEAVDSPALTAAELAGAKPSADALPEVAAAIRRRGPVKTKAAVSIRLDIDLPEKIRSGGPGWQSRVNDVLRKHVAELAS